MPPRPPRPPREGDEPRKEPSRREPKTAQQYFDEQIAKMPLDPKEDAVSQVVREEARKAAQDAAERFKRSRITSDHSERILSAADNLLLAGRLGDAEAIAQARRSLRDAQRNIEGKRARKLAFGVWDTAKQGVGTIQTLVYGTDFGLAFRQGGPLTFNPLNILSTARAFARLYNATGREKGSGFTLLPGARGAEYVRKQLESHPYYQVAKNAGLEMSLLSETEEVYGNNIAMRLPWVKRTEAGNAAFLDYMRLQEFGRYADRINKSSRTEIQKQDGLKAAAEVINTLTGRTNLGDGKVKQIADALNGFIGSPRLNISRIKMLDPTWIAREWRKNPEVGKQMIQDAVSVASLILGTMALGAAADAWEVQFDPEKPDFGKIRIGDTRYDINFGLTPLLRLVYKAGKYGYKAATDAVQNTEESDKERKAAAEVANKELWRYAEGRLGPATGYFADLFTGKDWQNRPVEVRQALSPADPNSPWRRLLAPVAVQEAVETATTQGAKQTLKTAPFEMFGIGAKAYDDRPGYVKPRPGSKWDAAMNDLGVDTRFIQRDKRDTDALFKMRSARVQEWTDTYGERLVSHPRWTQLSAEEKKKAASNLRSAITEQSKMKRPDLSDFDAGRIIAGVKRAATEKPKSDRKKIYAEP